MKVCLGSLVLLVAATIVGCAEKKVESTYELSEVEQLLKEHPELDDPPPPQYREK
ncbi:hypothetical protein [Allorhodopirellula solitaria]|uniref:Uncharacterized protein n=1 Tax=Allorhodopirellula solitaria TaxID=2527987 RepID=A0A5C5WHB9_9BACT|nr:hypothetical protein [Allorhodopirellula solitaria]TWT50050.1 hypothetical protein CA85_52770 [Allorhodopirellula solitaria]